VGSALDVVTGWGLFVSLATTVGAVSGRWVILPRNGTAGTVPSRSLYAAAARLGKRATLLLGASLVLVFVRQALEFHDPFTPWPTDVRVLLLGTTWGPTWMAAVAATVVARGAFGLAARGRAGGWISASVAVAALGAFPAFTGHANAGPLRGFTLMADTLHVWAVGGWIGGLALVLSLERHLGPRGGEGQPSLLPTLVPRFSRLALVCVPILVGTGVSAAWIHLGSPAGLVDTAYGRVLLVKIALVLAVLALGALSWRRLSSALDGHGGQAALRRAATVELVVANVVLAVTAVLVRMPPR